MTMKPPRPIANANRAVWIAYTFLKETRIGRNRIFPAHLAKHSGMTRLESELALRLVVASDMAIRRDDGRYFCRREKTT